MSANGSALDAAARFLTALSDRDVDTVAAAVDPSVLSVFQQQCLLALAADCLRHELELETGHPIACLVPARANDPANLERYGSTPMPAFAGAPTISALAALTPVAFFAAALATNVTRLRPFRLATGAPAFTVLGEIMESDTQAHVLYRQHSIDGCEVPSDDAVQRLSLVRHGGEWFVQLDRQLRILATPRRHEKPRRDVQTPPDRI